MKDRDAAVARDPSLGQTLAASSGDPHTDAKLRLLKPFNGRPAMRRPIIAITGLLLALALGAGSAQAQEPGADHLAKGDYYFQSGYYLKASEHYRLALLEDPTSPQTKLAFGHALFAIGNYSYASYALRRGVAQLDDEEPFQPAVASLFPNERAFVQALRNLKTYVTYSPRDPAGLTVLGYVLFSVDGEERRCRDMFRYLRRLDANDPFADYFLAQLDRREGREGVPDAEPLPPLDLPDVPPDLEDAPPEPPEPEVEVTPEPAPEPEARPLDEVLSEPERERERAESEWPSPVEALSD